MPPKNDAAEGEGRMENAMAEVPVETEGLLELLLNHALEAEGNFLALYDVAIRKAQGQVVKEKLTAFRGDHERHIMEIRGVLEGMEASVFIGDPAPTPLALGIAKRLEETDSDEVLLTEFLASEDFSRHLYTALASVPAPEPFVRIIQRGLEDEERHYAWAAKQLGLDVEE